MTKVKLCLDAGCSKQILLDDGRCIIQVKNKCAFGRVPHDFRQKLDQITRETKEQIFLSGDLFKNVKEGSELEI